LGIRRVGFLGLAVSFLPNTREPLDIHSFWHTRRSHSGFRCRNMRGCRQDKRTLGFDKTHLHSGTGAQKDNCQSHHNQLPHQDKIRRNSSRSHSSVQRPLQSRDSPKVTRHTSPQSKSQLEGRSDMCCQRGIGLVQTHSALFPCKRRVLLRDILRLQRLDIRRYQTHIRHLDR